MICEAEGCGELATCHLTEIKDGKKRETHYCEPCMLARMTAAAKAAVLEAVSKAKEHEGQKGVSLLMEGVDSWAGSTDELFAKLGRARPYRPQQIYDGISEALVELDPKTMPITHSLALISTLHTLKDQVSECQCFIERTYAHYVAVEGEAKAKRLLVGLR